MAGVFLWVPPSRSGTRRYKLQNMSDDGREKAPTKALARIEEHLGLSMRGARIGTLDPAVVTLLQSLVASAVSNQTVPIERRIFLTMAESSELSGLSAGFLRRLIRDG